MTQFCHYAFLFFILTEGPNYPSQCLRKKSFRLSSRTPWPSGSSGRKVGNGSSDNGFSGVKAGVSIGGLVARNTFGAGNPEEYGGMQASY